MAASAELFFADPFLQAFNRRESVEAWHAQVNFHLEQVSNVISESLYELFGRPSFDYRRARTAYADLLGRLAVSSAGGHWVYATTNYDKIADETLDGMGYPIAWGERLRPIGGERYIQPYGL